MSPHSAHAPVTPHICPCSRHGPNSTHISLMSPNRSPCSGCCSALPQPLPPAPPQIHHLEQPTSNYVHTAVETAVNIHRNDLPGDILIFLTGATPMRGAAGIIASVPCIVSVPCIASVPCIVSVPCIASVPCTRPRRPTDVCLCPSCLQAKRSAKARCGCWRKRGGS
jgi:hypothetical protein